MSGKYYNYYSIVGEGRGELEDFKVLTIWIRVNIYSSIKVVM